VTLPNVDGVPTAAEFAAAHPGLVPAGPHLGEVPAQVESMMRQVQRSLDYLSQKTKGLVGHAKAWHDWIDSWADYLGYLWPVFPGATPELIREVAGWMLQGAQRLDQIVKNLSFDWTVMIALRHDLGRWIRIESLAQQWSDEVTTKHLDLDFDLTGRSASRYWTGVAADSYASLWPYQVSGGGRRLQTVASSASAEIGRLFTIGGAVFGAWAMFLGQLVVVLGLDLITFIARVAKFRDGGGSYGAVGDIKTLLRLWATAEIAETAVVAVDSDVADRMTVLMQNRGSLRSSDRYWPNPLLRTEFVHPVLAADGTVVIEAGASELHGRRRGQPPAGR
jgi:hypothetical protein